MAAANTDKWRKKKSRFSTTLNGSITDSDVVMTLNSVSGLPTDTAITLIINRVDANGTATPAAMEVVTGVVSGSTVINLLRAEDGTTARAHASGSIVEQVFEADGWNDAVDAILSEHHQDGSHKNINSLATHSPAGAGTTTIYPSLAKINTVTMPAATQTLAVSGEIAGQFFLVEIINTTSQGALTWFSTIKWVDGVAPILTGTNGKKDVFGFRVTSAGNYDGYVLGQNI